MIFMLERLEHRYICPDLPYELKEPEDASSSLIRLLEISLKGILWRVPDIYTGNDRKSSCCLPPNPYEILEMSS
jgi:hypothetical protein